MTLGTSVDLRRPVAASWRRASSFSDSHEGLKAAIGQILGCPWQRCTVHFLREMCGHVHRGQQGMIGAGLRQIFQAPSGEEARRLCREVIVRLEAVAPKVAGLLAEAEDDLVAFYQMPTEHWSKLRSTNPLERVNREIGRRSDVVGIFPNDAALLRLAASLLIEQNDDWLVGRRYLSEGSMALVLGRSEADGGPVTPALASPQGVIARA